MECTPHELRQRRPRCENDGGPSVSTVEKLRQVYTQLRKNLSLDPWAVLASTNRAQQFRTTARESSKDQEAYRSRMSFIMTPSRAISVTSIKTSMAKSLTHPLLGKWSPPPITTAILTYLGD